jgi:hypothetical protein
LGGGNWGLWSVTRHEVLPRNRDTKFCREPGRAYTTGQPVGPRPGRRTSHASSPPCTRTPSPLAAPPRRSRWPHHRRGTGPGPAHRPRVDSALPSAGTTRGDARLWRLWGRDPETAGRPRASGSGPAPRPPELGCGSDPRDVATPVPPPLPARGAHPAAVVPAGRAGARTGRAAACGRGPTGGAAP